MLASLFVQSARAEQMLTWVPEVGYCSIPEFQSRIACETPLGRWIETVPEHCSDSQYTDKSSCEAPYMKWNTARFEEWHCHDGSKHTNNTTQDSCEWWRHEWTQHLGGEGWHCHEEYSKHIENDESTCTWWKHEWTKHERAQGWCEYPDGRRYEYSSNEENCLDSKRGFWYQTVPEHCADGTNKNRDQCLAVGAWTGVAAHCSDRSSKTFLQCNAAAQEQIKRGVNDIGDYCQTKEGYKRCNQINFEYNNDGAAGIVGHEYTQPSRSWRDFWPAKTQQTAAKGEYCARGNRCIDDITDPSVPIINEEPVVGGKKVTFQIKGKTKDFLYYPVADNLGWDSVSNLQPCECDSGSFRDCQLDPFALTGTTNPNECYDRYTTQVATSETTKYDIFKSSVFTAPAAVCDVPLLLGGTGVYACSQWNYDRIESSPRGDSCSCNSSNRTVDCASPFTGNYTTEGSECYDSKLYVEPVIETRYVRVKKVKRFTIEPYRSSGFATDSQLAVGQNRCFGRLFTPTVEELSDDTTQYTAAVYGYTRTVNQYTRSDPNDSVSCRIKVTSQYGRNVLFGDNPYAAEYFQTVNFLYPARVLAFNVTGRGAQIPKGIKVYKNKPVSVTLSWDTAAAESITLTGDGLPEPPPQWRDRPEIRGSVTVSNLTYGTHTYYLTAYNSNGTPSDTATVVVEVADPPLRIVSFSPNPTRLKDGKYDPDGQPTVAFTFTVEGADKVEFYCHSGWLAWKKCDPGGGILGFSFVEKPLVFYPESDGADIVKMITIPGADLDDTYAKLVACKGDYCLPPREIIVKEITQGRINWCIARTVGSTAAVFIGACLIGAGIGTVAFPVVGTIAGCFAGATGLTGGGTAATLGGLEGVGMCINDPDSYFISFGGVFGPGGTSPPPSLASGGSTAGSNQPITTGGTTGIDPSLDLGDLGEIKTSATNPFDIGFTPSPFVVGDKGSTGDTFGGLPINSSGGVGTEPYGPPAPPLPSPTINPNLNYTLGGTKAPGAADTGRLSAIPPPPKSSLDTGNLSITNRGSINAGGPSPAPAARPPAPKKSPPKQKAAPEQDIPFYYLPKKPVGGSIDIVLPLPRYGDRLNFINASGISKDIAVTHSYIIAGVLYVRGSNWDLPEHNRWYIATPRVDGTFFLARAPSSFKPPPPFQNENK